MERDKATLEDLVLLISSTRDEKLIEDLLIGLTTPSERAVLLRRIDIVKRLLDGEPQHNIAADLQVGVGTVTRGAKELKSGRFKILRNTK